MKEQPAPNNRIEAFLIVVASAIEPCGRPGSMPFHRGVASDIRRRRAEATRRPIHHVARDRAFINHGRSP
jgi:hypothetical protein